MKKHEKWKNGREPLTPIRNCVGYGMSDNCHCHCYWETDVTVGQHEMRWGMQEDRYCFGLNFVTISSPVAKRRTDAPRTLRRSLEPELPVMRHAAWRNHRCQPLLFGAAWTWSKLDHDSTWQLQRWIDVVRSHSQRSGSRRLHSDMLCTCSLCLTSVWRSTVSTWSRQHLHVTSMSVPSCCRGSLCDLQQWLWCSPHQDAGWPWTLVSSSCRRLWYPRFTTSDVGPFDTSVKFSTRPSFTRGPCVIPLMCGARDLHDESLTQPMNLANVRHCHGYHTGSVQVSQWLLLQQPWRDTEPPPHVSRFRAELVR